MWAFWHQHLHAPLPVLTLPLDFPRPAAPSFQADAYALRLSAHTTSSLRLLAERLGTTMQTVLLSAFQTFLFRYTGQDEVLIGCPVAARPESVIHEVVGMPSLEIVS